MKDFYMQAHEDLMAEYLGRHPHASEGEAYERTADLAYDRMIDRIADMADDRKTRRRGL